jgi:hypothetical protein
MEDIMERIWNVRNSPRNHNLLVFWSGNLYPLAWKVDGTIGDRN